MSSNNGLKGIFVYFSWEEALKSLSPEDFKILILALMQYAQDRDAKPTLPPPLIMAFNLMKGSIDEAIERKNTVSATRSAAGKLGGRPKNQNEQELFKNQKKQMLSEKQMLFEKANEAKKAILNETRLNETRLDEIKPDEIKPETPLTPLSGGTGTEPTELKKFPAEKIRELWNAICTALPPVRGINGNREKTLRARWNEHPDIDWWKDFFNQIAASDFLNGRSTNWKTSFDWCIKPANMDKILEGNYANKEAKKHGTNYDDDDDAHWHEFPTWND